MDSEVAYDNFKCVVELLEPNKVIFVSKLAYKNFCKSNQGVLDSGLFDFVPHPASAWWNKKSYAYGAINGEPSTGKEKFLRLISKF